MKPSARFGRINIEVSSATVGGFRSLFESRSHSKHFFSVAEKSPENKTRIRVKTKAGTARVGRGCWGKGAGLSHSK